MQDRRQRLEARRPQCVLAGTSCSMAAAKRPSCRPGRSTAPDTPAWRARHGRRVSSRHRPTRPRPPPARPGRATRDVRRTARAVRSTTGQAGDEVQILQADRIVEHGQFERRRVIDQPLQAGDQQEGKSGPARQRREQAGERPVPAAHCPARTSRNRLRVPPPACGGRATTRTARTPARRPARAGRVGPAGRCRRRARCLELRGRGHCDPAEGGVVPDGSPRNRTNLQDRDVTAPAAVPAAA